MYALAVHGGAGTWRPEKHEAALDGVRSAVTAGRGVLASSGTAIDAVCAAVVSLEDTHIFNAGTGACFNVDGTIELDAMVMIGEGLLAGGVTNLQRVKNPVLVARKVMEETDHVLLGGEGALRFARAMGFEDYDPSTPERREVFEKKIKRMRTGRDTWLPRMHELLKEHPELAHGTVGAVAVDAHGGIAAATSTGGVTLKLVGRVGDTPIPGAGTYATEYGAASATGRGEIMMRACCTRAVCDRIEGGRTAQDAVEDVIDLMAETVGTQAGVIAVDAQGRVGAAHATDWMPHAWVTEAMDDVRVAMRVP